VEAAEHPTVAQITRNTLALVLAGGRGTRLGPLTDWRAKPAVPFGGKFRIIDFTLSNCVNSGIRRIGICTQYKAQSLIRHVQQGWSFLDGRFGEFIELLPAQQRIAADWYRGTADAVYQNLDIIVRQDPDYVLILAGDHVYKMDYGKMLAEHVRRGSDMSIACVEVPVGEATGLGILQVDTSGRVVGFQEKPARPAPMPGHPGVALASMGIYAFKADFLYQELHRNAAYHGEGHDFGKDIIPNLVERGRSIYAHRFNDSCVNMVEGVPYWRDVGTIDAYWEANIALTKVTPDLNLYDREWPIWTYQEQLPPAKFVFDDDGRRGLAVDSMVSGGDIISGAVVRRSVLFSNVRALEGSRIEDSVVLPDVVVGRNVVLKRAVVDRYCKLPDGFSAGVNAAEDRKTLHVTDKGITLIAPEMLDQYVHHVR
jgi:glucose-1-phosphate adenylyltransferase